MTSAPIRCSWRGMAGDPLYEAYHDTEWGVPEYDSRALWEKLVLDGFQAGLAWITVLCRDAWIVRWDLTTDRSHCGSCPRPALALSSSRGPIFDVGRS